MISLIFIVNSKVSSKTDRFWKNNQPVVSAFFPNAAIHSADFLDSVVQNDVSSYEVVVLVGDDLFFNQAVNKLYQVLIDTQAGTTLAFLPDSRNSALSYGLGWPGRFKEQLELIRSNQSIPMDIVRCHYIDNDGIPSSQLILNDVLIGTPKIRFPWIFKNISHWMSLLTVFFLGKRHKHIELINQNTTLYEGDYIFSLLLLGKKITNGPKVSNKTRINLAKFEYYQFNRQPIFHLPAMLTSLFSSKKERRHRFFLQEKFVELEIKGIGEENSIVADGVCLGRLPASFILLPKAINVISPLIAVRVMQTWKSRISNKAAKPVGNSMFTDLNFMGLPMPESVTHQNSRI